MTFIFNELPWLLFIKNMSWDKARVNWAAPLTRTEQFSWREIIHISWVILEASWSIVTISGWSSLLFVKYVVVLNISNALKLALVLS